MRIEMNIEELVLHGFDPADRDRIKSGVEHELIRLLAGRRGLEKLACSRQLDELHAGSFQVKSNTVPEAIGSQVARAVHGGLNR